MSHLGGMHMAPGPALSRDEGLHGEPGGITAPAGSLGTWEGAGEVFALGFWLCLHTNTFA